MKSAFLPPFVKPEINKHLDTKIDDSILDLSREKVRLMRVLLIPDLHLPLVNDKMIDRLTEEIKNSQKVIIMGDFLDFDSLSKFFPKKFGSMLLEIKTSQRITKNFLKALENIEVIYLVGNHEERFDKKLSEVFDDLREFFSLEELLKKGNIVPEQTKFINIKEEGKLYRVDKHLALLHGHETTVKTATYPASAIGRRISIRSSIVFGHFHQYDIKIDKNEDDFRYIVSLPMAGKPNMGYVYTSSYHNGYAIYEDKDLTVFLFDDDSNKMIGKHSFKLG